MIEQTHEIKRHQTSTETGTIGIRIKDYNSDTVRDTAGSKKASQINGILIPMEHLQ
ncbi:hypothetical protein [Sediminibacter sp. Hel_I_10]|uniref:hypothetical protein n=1 Tax=Sediminibacter sp. Hel_I_10 TaxID=1392490 RepID=UPI000B260B22|nr:hypothetical protein [Sediminibacter sp. Hel_I_10]